VNRSSLLHVQQIAGNGAATALLERNRHPATAGPTAVERQVAAAGEAYAPRESPVRAPATVERAKALKVTVDLQTETLLASSLMLSEVATPVIDQFVAAHRNSYDTLRQILKPYLPGAGLDWGTVLSYAIGIAGSLLPIPARAFYEIARELIVETVQSKASSAVNEPQEAMEAARNGLILANWLAGADEAGDAAVRAGAVVRQNYDSATKLQLAVLRPWNGITSAQSRGDQAGMLEAAVQFVAVAPTFVREAQRASDASRSLVVSYLVAALSNSEGDELRRKLAVVLPAVVESLGGRGSPGADYSLGPFVGKVLAHFYPEIRREAFGRRVAGRYNIADVSRRGRELLAPDTGAGTSSSSFDATLEYQGIDLGVFRGEPTVTRLHDLAEEKEQTSLPSVADAVRAGEPWVTEESVVVMRGGHGGGSDAHRALDAARPDAVAARQHWGRIAGVIPD
jgi:hypothetical protein